MERCVDDEIPFEIPDSWAWVRVGSLGSLVRGAGIKRTQTVVSGKPCVRYGELYTTYTYSFARPQSYIPETLDSDCKHFSTGDVLFTLTGENKQEIGKAVAYIGNGTVAAGGDLAYWERHGMNPLYLAYFMYSPYAIMRKATLATGDIIVHISADKISSILLPVPPLREQTRIVSRVETLYRLL